MIVLLALLFGLGGSNARLLPFYPENYRDCSNVELLDRMPFLKHLEHRVGIPDINSAKMAECLSYLHANAQHSGSRADEGTPVMVHGKEPFIPTMEEHCHDQELLNKMDFPQDPAPLLNHPSESHSSTTQCLRYLTAERDRFEAARSHEENLAKFLFALIGLALTLLVTCCCVCVTKCSGRTAAATVGGQSRQACAAAAAAAAVSGQQRQNREQAKGGEAKSLTDTLKSQCQNLSWNTKQPDEIPIFHESHGNETEDGDDESAASSRRPIYKK